MDNSEQIKDVSNQDNSEQIKDECFRGRSGVAGGLTLRVPWAQAWTERFEALKNNIDALKEQIEILKNFNRQLRRKLSVLRHF